MSLSDSGSLVLRYRCRELAREMVALERWAAEAYEQNEWTQVGELHSLREEVQQRRSALLRQYWSRRDR